MTVCKLLNRICIPTGKPDLRSQVRLFVSALDHFPGKFFKIREYFKVYLLVEDEAILGSNHRFFEIRLYFIRHRAVSDEIFLIFILDILNWRGIAPVLVLRPLLSLALWHAVRISGNALK
jgi:hypothetical protein